jgi:hypothetical protein
MMGSNGNKGDKQQPNNQIVHGRGRRKMVVAKGDLTNDCINQSTQQSTNDGGERMGRL